MNNTLTKEDKKRIYDMLADAYIEVIKRQQIGTYERKNIAKNVLDAVGKAKTMQEIIDFLQSLVNNYPYFQFSKKIFSNEIGVIREQKVIGQLQNYIKTLAT